MRFFSIFLAAVLAVGAASCGGRKGPKRTNWSVSLSRADTIPYGTALAWKTLEYHFPMAKIEALGRGYRYNNLRELDGYYTGSAALVMVGLNFQLSEAEGEALLDFVREGNEAVIFCTNLDKTFARRLGCYKESGWEEYPPGGLTNYYQAADNASVLTLRDSTGRKWGHRGRYLTGTFALSSLTADTGKRQVVSYEYGEGELNDDDALENAYEPTVHGRANGRANFIRYSIGAGHLSLHAAPLTLSNYFLLQPANRAYLSGVWSAAAPGEVSYLYWHEYFKRRSEGSSFGMLWEHPATRWALILALLGLLIYVLFESKRRQRIVPIVKPLENSSVQFVETVGRLYYDRGDHANLASKMVQHFLEWVRNTYNLPTTEMSSALADALARKSGQSPENAAKAVRMASEVRGGMAHISEEYLHDLHRTFHAFYHNA